MASNTFSADIANFVAKSKLRTEVVVRRIAFDAFRRVVYKTPVDTGRARANWQVGMNQLPKGITLSSAGSSGSSGIGRYKLGDIIYIANNLPYIGVLEYGGYPNPPKTGTKTVGGYSRQAPQGMVGVTMIEISANLRSLAEGAK